MTSGWVIVACRYDSIGMCFSERHRHRSLATGAGYEINAQRRQMAKPQDDYQGERISREECEQRRRQKESGSIIY